MKAPSLTEVFRLNEDPAATGQPAHISLARLKYLGDGMGQVTREIMILALCHMFLVGEYKGKTNAAVEQKIKDIEHGLLKNGFQGAAQHMISLNDPRYVERAPDGWADDDQEWNIAACSAFYETYWWSRCPGIATMLQNLPTDSYKDQKSGRLFSVSFGDMVGEWDTPKKVGSSHHLIAGNLLLALGEGGHFDRAWRVDLVAADSTASDADRVAADKASEER